MAGKKRAKATKKPKAKAKAQADFDHDIAVLGSFLGRGHEFDTSKKRRKTRAN